MWFGTNSAVCHEYGLEKEANRGLLRQKFGMNVVFTHSSANESQSEKKNKEKKKTAIACAKRICMHANRNPDGKE